MMRVLRRFLSLPNRDRNRVIRALTCMVVAPVALKAFGFHRCHKLINRRSARLRHNLPTDQELLGELLRSYQRVTSTLTIGKCLSRSLAMRFYLQTYGINAEMRIGVARTGHELDAHAWVEYNGQALLETVPGRYAAFSRLE